jgi:hypothetical protein
MDRKEKLEELYTSIIENIDSQSITQILLSDIEDIEKAKQNIDIHFQKTAECYDKYLGLITDPSQKHIALRRLKNDFHTYRELSSEIFNYNQSLIRGPHSKVLRKINSQIWIGVCGLVDERYNMLEFDCANEDLARLEFELIGATPSSRKNKPTKEQKLALNQNELMYLFKKLGAKDIFTKTDNTHLARGIETLSNFSANKTREKGTNMKLTELENIKTILDSVSESLNADIKQSKAETN